MGGFFFLWRWWFGGPIRFKLLVDGWEKGGVLMLAFFLWDRGRGLLFFFFFLFLGGWVCVCRVDGGRVLTGSWGFERHAVTGGLITHSSAPRMPS